MSKLSVLRIGPFPEDNDSAARTRRALLDHFRASDGNRITISNRYFTANVLLGEIGLECDATEDGIILVFDALVSNPKLPTSMTASFDALDAIHDRETTGELLRLCVGVGDSRHNSTEKEYEREYSRRVLWCLDRGYEYVEADLSREGVTRGHDDRDKEGFARIVEAISGTVWSSAIMEKRKKEDLKETFEEAKTQIKESNYCPPDASQLLATNIEARDAEREAKARSALLNEEKGYAESGANRQEVEDEQALQAFEGTLREATRIRELSKSGQLSDEVRRKRAGDAATLLMNVMGQMGFDESSDDDDVNAVETSSPEQ